MAIEVELDAKVIVDLLANATTLILLSLLSWMIPQAGAEVRTTLGGHGSPNTLKSLCNII